MKKKIREDLPCLLLIVAVSVIFFYPCLFMGKEFYWYNDQQFQYHIFYQEWNNIIQEIKASHTLAVYSWNTFLGTDFFVSKLFTCVGDFIATPYFILHSGEVDYSLLLCVETIICMALSGYTMRLFLHKFGIRKKYILDGFSIVYAFSGYIMLFCGTYMFHRFYCLFPLLLYFCEKYLQEKKLAGFALTVSVLFLQNYELMFSASVFLVLYFFFSKKMKENSIVLDVLKCSLPLIGAYLVGILLVGFALVPLFLFIKTGSRIGTFDYGELFWNPHELFYFFSNLFYAPINMRSDEPFYLFYSSRYTSATYSVFIGPITVLAMMNLGKLKKQERINFIVSEIVIISFLLIRPLNMIVHGFSEPTFRWSFVLLAFNCLMCAYICEKTEIEVRFKNVLFYCLIMLGFFVLDMYANGYLNTKYIISLTIYTASLLQLFIFSFISKKNQKVMVALNVLESVICFAYAIETSWANYPDGECVKFNQEYLDFYKEADEDEMYRIYFDSEEIKPYSSLCLNDAMEYGYMSTTTYDSAYSWILGDFLNRNGYENWIIDIDEPELLKMLGVKYIGVVEDKTIIDQLDISYAYNLDNIEIYKINDSNHIGHTYSSFIKESEADDAIDWNKVLIVDDETYQQIKDYKITEKAQLNVVEYNRQYMKGEISASDDTVLFVSIPYSSGWNVEDQNGNKLTTINVQGGFLGVLIDENVTEISFYYGTPGLKTGLLLSLTGLFGIVVLLVHDKRKSLMI